MMKNTYLVLFTLLLSHLSFSQEISASYVDYDGYIELVKEVREHRLNGLVNFDQFNKMALDNNTVILDTRSKEMYDAKHVKGAIHLNFSDFTLDALNTLLQHDTTKRILIYCNNNFRDDQLHFAFKGNPSPPELGINKQNAFGGVSLALNIPTYINLYGYGYKNVYELNELISTLDSRIQFEGTEVLEIDSDKSIFSK